jgi:hypothetical protein
MRFQKLEFLTYEGVSGGGDRAVLRDVAHEGPEEFKQATPIMKLLETLKRFVTRSPGKG